MRKLLFVFTLMAILLLGVWPTLATPIDELNDLARYLPADTPIFISSRIDEAYFETLDGLIARVAAVAPPGSIPPVSIGQWLDQALAEEMPGVTFSGDVRPWMGDTLVVGVLEIPTDSSAPGRMLREMDSDDAPMIFGVAITDRAAATSFITEAMTSNDTEFVQTDEADYTTIADPDGDGIIVIRDDVILVSNQPETIASGGVPDGSLQGNADFTDSFSRLPASDYNLGIYIDLGAFIQQAIEQDEEAAEMMSSMGPLFNALGPTAIGGTILEDVSLTLDIAQIIDPAIYEELGVPAALELSPVDPAFAAHVPGGAPLAILGTGISTQFESAMAGFNLQAEMLGSEGEEVDEMFQQGLATFTQFTGLDLQEDVISWMTGNYALFVMLNPELNTTSAFGVFQTFPVDFGIAIEATDPVKAAETVEGLTAGIEKALALIPSSEDEEVEIEITTETIVGTSTTVITATAPDAPWPIELLLGANGEVFALGTRNAVTAIFARDGGLPANTAYARAQDFVLENNISLAYLGPEGLLPLADLITAFDNSESDQAEATAQSMRDGLGLISSATISQSLDSDGTARSRLVLTLSE